MDVHVPRAVTTGLRLRGVDVLTAQEDAATELEDADLLKRATELGRVLVSQDDDLLRLGTQLQKTSGHFGGIIYAHQLRLTIGQLMDDLDLIAKTTTTEEWRSRIEYLPL